MQTAVLTPSVTGDSNPKPKLSSTGCLQWTMNLISRPSAANVTLQCHYKREVIFTKICEWMFSHPYFLRCQIFWKTIFSMSHFSEFLNVALPSFESRTTQTRQGGMASNFNQLNRKTNSSNEFPITAQLMPPRDYVRKMPPLNTASKKI